MPSLHQSSIFGSRIESNGHSKGKGRVLIKRQAGHTTGKSKANVPFDPVFDGTAGSLTDCRK